MYKWDPEQFKKSYTADSKAQRVLLKQVADHSDNYTEKFSVPTTIKFSAHDVKYSNKLNRKGVIVFEDLTTDGAIVKYTSMLLNGRYYNVAAHNFASRSSPGGGYVRGAMAQEEANCYQYPILYYSLYEASQKRLYPLNAGNALVTPNIERIRDTLENGFAIIEKPTVRAMFVSAAAPNLRDTKTAFKDVQKGVEATFEVVMKCPVAYDETINCLILGGFGCGVFAPQTNRAEYVKEMAKCTRHYAETYQHLYDVIVIALPSELDSENYTIFRDVFLAAN